jgi:DNA-binding PadR family transcriptional regulator
MHAMTMRRLCDPRVVALLMSGGRGERGRHHHHRHRHRGGPGFGPWGPAFGGPGGPFGRRGRRMQRGDVRAAILVLLDEEPRNGYGLMQEIEQRSEGAWRPSPGSVYPALSQLEDEGLIRAETRDGRKLFALTDAGRRHVEEHREELGAPWEDASGGLGEHVAELRDLLWQVGTAAMQVVQAGDEQQVARARQVLTEARRSLYRILAGDDPAPEDTTDDGADAAPPGTGA